MRLVKIKNIKAFIVSAVMAVALVFMSGQAHALLLTESYVFVGSKGGSAIFKMKNTTKKPEAYRLEWVELLMNEKGAKTVASDQELSAAGVMAASPYMYVAPRRLMIQPGQLQNVRFMVRRNNNMVPGEYRSYISISPEEIPDSFDPESGEPRKGTGGGRSVEITMLTGYRIPVFLLHGDTTLDVSFSDVSVVPDTDGRYKATYTLNRSGTRSALGQIRLFCEGPDGQIKILSRSDARVFKEIASRTYTRKFEVPAGGCSNYQIGFRVHDQDPLASQDYLATAPLNIR